MLRVIVPGVILAGGLLCAGIAQDLQARVRQALSYPPLIAEVRVEFEVNSTTLAAAFGTEPEERQLTRLRQQVEQNPDDADAWLQLARAYEKHAGSDDETEAALSSQKAFERAAALYRQRLERSPNDPTCMARLADALRGAGKLSEAQQLARKAVQLDSRTAEHWEVAGRVAMSAALEKIVGAPTQALYFLDIGDRKVAREARPYLREAYTAYEQCLQRAPTHREALLALAQVEAWETVLAIGEEDSETFAERMRQLRRRVMERLQRSPYGMEAALTTGLLLSAADTLAGANFPPEIAHQYHQELKALLKEVKPRLEAAYQKAEGQSRVRLGLIRAILQYLEPTGSGITPELVREMFQTLHSLEPENREWWSGLLAITAAQEKWDEVEQLAHRLLQRKPDPEIYHWLIVALDRQGKLDEANRNIDALSRAFPEDPYAMLFRSLQLMRMRANAESLRLANQLLETAAKSFGDSPRSLHWGPVETIRAAYLAMTGAVDEARRRVEQVLLLYPKLRFAEQLKRALQETKTPQE